MSSLLGRLRMPTGRKSPNDIGSPTESDDMHRLQQSQPANAQAGAISRPPGAAAQNGAGNGKGKPLYLCNPFLRSHLVKGSFRPIIQPPKYTDVNEHVAITIWDLFHHYNSFYAVISSQCTTATCPTMSAAPGCNFTWPDQQRRMVSLPAPTYIDYVTDWIQRLLNDDSVFPTKTGSAFHPSFPSTARHIAKQLARAWAHLYHAHFDALLHLSMEAHTNSNLAHFIAFCHAFDLIDQQDWQDMKAGGGGIASLAEKWAEMGVIEL